MSKQVVDNIKLYKFQRRNIARENIFISISSAGMNGYGEYSIPTAMDGENEKLANILSTCYGKNVADCLDTIGNYYGKLPATITQAVELALIDLQGKLLGTGAGNVIELFGNEEVIEMHSLDTHDNEKLDSALEHISAKKQYRGIKIRLSGDYEADLNIIEKIRKKYLIDSGLLVANGSFNCADLQDYSAENTGIRLLKFHTAGLDVVEDPVKLEYGELRNLSEFISPLSLALEAQVRNHKAMSDAAKNHSATVYKITPGISPSVFSVIDTAKEVNSLGMLTAVSQGNFIGVGCSQWQQMAVLLGCKWVESLIRPSVSKIYSDALLQNGTESKNGFCSIKPGVNGFGIEFDTEKLKNSATAVINV